MWRPWAHKSALQLHTKSSPFYCSSFKDIQHLCTDESFAKKSPSVFHRARRSRSSIFLPGGESQIVIYLTSLRIVRTTFEDCKSVRSILRTFRVSIEERDLSMDTRFLNELKEILGQSMLNLPRVFIGGRYIGGAEEIRQLNEAGELKKFVEGLPTVESGVCDGCGGHRFILCDECNGGRKLYGEQIGFRTCTACNENGLIMCHCCSSAPF